MSKNKEANVEECKEYNSILKKLEECPLSFLTVGDLMKLISIRDKIIETENLYVEDLEKLRELYQAIERKRPIDWTRR